MMRMIIQVILSLVIAVAFTYAAIYAPTESDHWDKYCAEHNDRKVCPE